MIIKLNLFCDGPFRASYFIFSSINLLEIMLGRDSNILFSDLEVTALPMCHNHFPTLEVFQNFLTKNNKF